MPLVVAGFLFTRALMALGQAKLTTITALVPALAAFLPGLELRSPVVLVPIAGVAVGVKEILIGAGDPPMLLLTWLVNAGAAVAFLLLTAYTALVTFVFCLPIYLLALPLKVLNQQSAIVYLLAFPFAPLSAAGFGKRAGGAGWYALAVIVGVALGVALFVGTGALHAVVEALFRSGSGGGFSLPVGF